MHRSRPRPPSRRRHASKLHVDALEGKRLGLYGPGWRDQPLSPEADELYRRARDEMERLVSVGERSRNLRGHGLDEGASTRMLIHAARLAGAGIPLPAALRSGVVLPITDDPDVREALTAAVAACLP